MKHLFLEWVGYKVNSYGRTMISGVLRHTDDNGLGQVYIMWGTPDNIRTKAYMMSNGMELYYPRIQFMQDRINTSLRNHYIELTREEVIERWPNFLENIEMNLIFKKLKR